MWKLALTALIPVIFVLAVATTPSGADAKNAKPPKPYKKRFDFARFKKSIATSEATLAGLLWLKRHQQDDGSWRVTGFRQQCEDDKPCQLKGKALKQLPKPRAHDVGVTGLALLAFLGEGVVDMGPPPRPRARFLKMVNRGTEWLIGQQTRGDDPKTNGVFGPPEEGGVTAYNHAVATLALAERLALSRSPSDELKEAVTQATAYILRARHPQRGWRYAYQDKRSNSSVTGWMFMALKASEICAKEKLIAVDLKEIRTALDAALTTFDALSSQETGAVGYMFPGDQGSYAVGHAEPHPYSKDLHVATALAALCRTIDGKRKDPRTKSAVTLIKKQPPLWREPKGKRKGKINYLYWFYGSHVMAHWGGSKWKSWRDNLLEALLRNQRVLSCSDGSWDPIDEWSPIAGRTYSTAVAILAMQAEYRWARVR